eukprot:jgi/Mesen1/4908/ME000244S04083
MIDEITRVIEKRPLPILRVDIAKQARAQGPSSCDKDNFLHRCCRDVLKGWAVGFQNWTRAGRVKVTLWGGDAQQLCLYTLYPKPVDCREQNAVTGTAVQETAGRSVGKVEERVVELDGRAAGGGCRFDAIETSTLADWVGLLNLLLCCGPLLKQHARARLVTGTNLWYTVAPTVSVYAKYSLGFDVHLVPLLLGLRLCNDILFGTSSPPPQNCQGLRQQLPAECMEVLFEWAPSTVRCATPGNSSSCSGGQTSWGCDRGFLGDPAANQLTPLTLLGLEASSGSRPDAFTASPGIAQSGGTCGITSTLQHLQYICNYSSHSNQELFSHGWQAMLDFLALAEIGNPQAWNRWLLPAPSKSLNLKHITLYSKNVLGVPSFDRKSGPFFGWKGHIRLCLVVLQDETHISSFLKHLPALLWAQLTRDKCKRSSSSIAALLQTTAVHSVDNFSVTWDNRRLVFPLPAGHGLPERLTAVGLAEVVGCKLVGDPALLSEFEKVAVPEVSLEKKLEQAGAHKETTPLERGGGRTTARSSSKADTPVPAVSITALSEHVERYTGVVSFRPSAPGQVQMRERQLEGEDYYEDATWSVEVAVGSQSVVLRLAWPVVVSTAEVQVLRKRGTISFSLPKSNMWPPVGAKKLSMEALQPWPMGRAGDKRLELCLQGMFSLEEKDLLNVTRQKVVHLIFRHSVQSIFERFTKQKLNFFQVRDVAAPAEVADTLSVLIRSI